MTMSDGPWFEDDRPPAGLPATGNPEVDAILAGLHDLDQLPVAEHIAVFERVHRGLQNMLSEAADEDRSPAPDDSSGT